MTAKKLRPALLAALMAMAFVIGAIQAQAGNSEPVVIVGGICVGPAPSNCSAPEAQPDMAQVIPPAPAVENETADLAAESREQAEQGACAIIIAAVALLGFVPASGAAFCWTPKRVCA
jgi:hypothetical protein